MIVGLSSEDYVLLRSLSPLFSSMGRTFGRVNTFYHYSNYLNYKSRWKLLFARPPSDSECDHEHFTRVRVVFSFHGQVTKTGQIRVWARVQYANRTAGDDVSSHRFQDIAGDVARAPWRLYDCVPLIKAKKKKKNQMHSYINRSFFDISTFSFESVSRQTVAPAPETPIIVILYSNNVS